MREVVPKSNWRVKNRMASVLILVLLVMSSLALMVMGAAFRARVKIRLANSYADQVRAYYLALGGIARAKAICGQGELTADQVAKICRFESDQCQEGLFSQLKKVATEDIGLKYFVRDELGYLNVNETGPEVWQRSGLIDNQSCGAIVDWIDGDDDVSAGGAESDYYQRLADSYCCKNAKLRLVKELVFVRGIDRQIYTGNLMSGEGLFTVFGNGRININTTSGSILSALGGLDEAAAKAVGNYLAGGDGQRGSDDDKFIKNAGEISRIEGLSELETELLGEYCCFESNYFRFFSVAEIAGRRCVLMGTIYVDQGKAELVCVERLS